MLLYHGSNLIVAKPDLSKGRYRLDFGRGFYATTMPEQAEAWARRKAYEQTQQQGVVSIFEYLPTADCKTLAFKAYDREWLDFVVSNRTGKHDDGVRLYDIVSGGIADDRVIDTINFYIEELSLERGSAALLQLTLEQLSYQKPNDQVCFCTEKALGAITFIESYLVER